MPVLKAVRVLAKPCFKRVNKLAGLAASVSVEAVPQRCWFHLHFFFA